MTELYVKKRHFIKWFSTSICICMKTFLRTTIISCRAEMIERQHTQRSVYLTLKWKNVHAVCWENLSSNFYNSFSAIRCSKALPFVNPSQTDSKNSTNRLLSTVSSEIFIRFFVIDRTSSISLSVMCVHADCVSKLWRLRVASLMCVIYKPSPLPIRSLSLPLNSSLTCIICPVVCQVMHDSTVKIPSFIYRFFKISNLSSSSSSSRQARWVRYRRIQMDNSHNTCVMLFLDRQLATDHHLEHYSSHKEHKKVQSLPYK